MMNPEAIGAVPQAGVNPAANQPQQPQQQAPAGGMSPEDLKALRTDPELTEAVAKFMGRPVDMAEVPDDMLVVVAGMVHKLGVDGAIAEFERALPPGVAQQIRGAL